MNVLSVPLRDLDPSLGDEWFWDCDITRLSPEGRQTAYALKTSVGDTHLVVTLGLDGLAGLPLRLDIIEEAAQHGLVSVLACMGDGNDPGERDHDDGALGFSWLMAHFAEIVAGVRERGLMGWTVFLPGFDGVVPAWQPWARVEQFGAMARRVLGPDGYLALELSAGYWCYSGETDDWEKPEAKVYDALLYEFPPDMGPPDTKPPANYDALDNDAKNPWSQVWQVSKRVLGPHFNRPAEMPDDPGQFSGGPLTHQTPRGPYLVSAFEFDTFTRKRPSGARRTPDDVTERRRQHLKQIGWPYVC